MSTRTWLLITLVLVGAALVLWFLAAGADERGSAGLALLLRVLAGIAVAGWVVFYLVDLRRDWRDSGATLRRSGRDRREE